MKAIKIDPGTKTISMIDVDNSFTSENGMYKAMNCGTIEQISIGDNHLMLLDENGTFVKNNPIFAFAGYDFVGIALIVCINGDEYADVDLSVDEITERTFFAGAQ